MFYIKEEIKSNTLVCKNNFTCLTKEGKDLCKVVSCINDGSLFVYCVNSVECGYKHDYNGRVICTCPCRNEIYNQYNV